MKKRQQSAPSGDQLSTFNQYEGKLPEFEQIEFEQIADAAG
jgi:hypothetical protein